MILVIIVFVIILAIIVYFSYKAQTHKPKENVKLTLDLKKFTDEVIQETGFTTPTPMTGKGNEIPGRCNTYRFLADINGSGQPSYNVNVLLGDYDEGADTYTLPEGIKIINRSESKCLTVEDINAQYVTSICSGLTGVTGIDDGDCFNPEDGKTYSHGSTINYFQACQIDGAEFQPCEGELVFIRDSVASNLCMTYDYIKTTGYGDAKIRFDKCDLSPNQLFTMKRVDQIVQGQPISNQFGRFAAFEPINIPSGSGNLCLTVDRNQVGGVPIIASCSDPIPNSFGSTAGVPSNLGYLWNLQEFKNTGNEPILFNTDANNGGVGGMELYFNPGGLLSGEELHLVAGNNYPTEFYRFSIVPYSLAVKYKSNYGPILIPRV